MLALYFKYVGLISIFISISQILPGSNTTYCNILHYTYSTSWLYAGNAVVSQSKDKQASEYKMEQIFYQSHTWTQSKSINAVVSVGLFSLWNTSRSAFTSMSPRESDTEASKALTRFQTVRFAIYTQSWFGTIKPFRYNKHNERERKTVRGTIFTMQM